MENSWPIHGNLCLKNANAHELIMNFHDLRVLLCRIGNLYHLFNQLTFYYQRDCTDKSIA